MKYWVARDFDGTLLLHGYPPFLRERETEGGKEYFWDNEYGIIMWLGGANFHPEVTFENSPREATLLW